MNPEDQGTAQQYCFVGHSNEAPWRADILSTCAEVLPKFGLEPWYAADHYEPTKTLRDKVVKAIANARYGIYDLSSWQDDKGEWHLPRNVLIELGIAIVYNRPTLLLRHTSNNILSLPACLQGVEIIEFAGETTLKRELEKQLPQWIDALPERDWLNRFCIFGNQICRFREQHPRNQSWDATSSPGCHIADGIDKRLPGDRNVECDEIHGDFDDVLTRYESLPFRYLSEVPSLEGFQFRICSYCQIVRSTAFGIYRLFPHGSVDGYLSVGMSIAIGAFFDYEIPRVLVVQREEDLPSLLRGYEVTEARSTSELKRGLKARLPVVMQKLSETQWMPRPLPFVELQSAPLPVEASVEAPDARSISWVRCMQAVQAKIADITQRHEPPLCVRREIQERLLQYLASPRRRLAVVIGEPGMGKTHLLEHTAIAFNREPPNKSVVAFCTGVELARTSVEDVLAETIRGPGSIADRLAALDVQRREQDSNWRFVLIVDAINEHPDMLSLLRDLVQIWTETAGYPWFSLLLSCRSSIWDELAQQVAFGESANKGSPTRFPVGQLSPAEGHEAYELFQSRYLIKTKYSDLPRQVREFIEVPASLKLLCSAYQGQEIPLDLVLEGLEADRDLRSPVIAGLPEGTVEIPANEVLIGHTLHLENGDYRIEPLQDSAETDYFHPRSEDRWFLLKAAGNSMIEAGIAEDDHVLVRVQTQVESGEIAAVLQDDPSGTKLAIREFYRQNNRVVLKAANKRFKDEIFRATDPAIRILGKVVAVARPMSRSESHGEERQIARLNAVAEIGQRLMAYTGLSEQQVAELIYNEASRAMDTTNMYIALYDEATDTVRFVLAYRDDRRVDVEKESGWQPRTGGQGRTEEIIRTRKPLLFRTRSESDAWYRRPGYREYIGQSFSSWIGAPMIVGDKVLGVIATYHPTLEHAYDEADLQVLSIIAGQAAVAVQNARLSSNEVSAIAADIRSYLLSAYSNEEITTLCFDYFRDVCDSFAAGMTKSQKIHLLLEHCQRRDLLPNLVASLEHDRPDQFRVRFPQTRAEVTPVPGTPMRDPKQVFISHAHEDAEFAHRLADDLQRNGWRAWIVPDSIRPGEKWVEAINRGLEECGIFILVASPSAVQSRWVKAETNAAIELEHRGELRFVPVEAAECRMPMVWSAYLSISFTSRYSDGLNRLLTTLEESQNVEDEPPSESNREGDLRPSQI